VPATSPTGRRVRRDTLTGGRVYLDGARQAVVPAGPRPRLRGWLHAVAAPLAVVVAVLLWRAAAPGWSRGSVAVFGVGLVGLYATSGLYHVPRWPARVRRSLARLDVAMIQLFIVASFTPIAAHTLTGPWKVWSLGIAWTLGLIAAAVAASPLRGPRWLAVLGSTALGSLALVPLVHVATVLPPLGVALILAGCALYVLGGVVYARRLPDPWPRWFGFHEVFHLLVVAGGMMHVLAVWEFALPLA